MIFARDENPRPEPPPAENVMPGEEPRTARPPSTGRIPLRYNLETELTAEVKAGGPNTFTFALDKK
jgi:hypothetical protein